MFGDWDGLILRIVITVVVILGLVAVVYWLVRRYSTGGLGRIGRGRVPRLAVVDAMAVDGRRRLVLVRRDNVEHLILIGGPSDVVVEQAIQRPRVARPPVKPLNATPAPAPQPSSASDPVRFEPEPPEPPPIPFPQMRVPPAPPLTEPPAASPYRSERETPVREVPPPPPPPPAYQSSPQPIERPFPPLRRASAARADTTPAPAPAPAFEPALDARMDGASEDSLLGRFSPYGENGADGGNDALPEFLRPRVADEPSFTAPPAPQAADETSAKVNDLEREMARLLGEITQKH